MLNSGADGLNGRHKGMEETLTVMGMGLSTTLERMLSTTNAIENLMGTVRRVSRRVKRWRGGKMILRWMAAGVQGSRSRLSPGTRLS